jgi:hypothetical protein
VPDRSDNEESTGFLSDIPQEVVEAMPYGPGMVVRAVFQKVWDYLNKEPELQGDFRQALELWSVYSCSSEIKAIRDMFDVTRRRVLKAMGEEDMGKSWNWIEGETARVKRRLEAWEGDEAIAMLRGKE